MANLSVSSIMPAAGNITATEDLLDHTDETAVLAARATALEHVAKEVTQDALRFEDPAPSEEELDEVKYVINKSFGLTLRQQTTIQELREARKNGDIPWETYMEKLKELGVIGPEFDIAKVVSGGPPDAPPDAPPMM